MADDELHLLVGGIRYKGWKSIRVTRSMDTIAGSFALEVSDRWGNNDPWPIREEDPCRVQIDGETVIDGYVDKRAMSADDKTRSLSYSGRDRAAALVDCSALVNEGTVAKSKWTIRDADVFEIATKIAARHDIKVSLQAGLASAFARHKKVVMSPGDSGFEVISKLASAAGVRVVSDGAGGIVLTRSSNERATSLVEGQNIKTAQSDYDGTDRYYRYLVSSQIPATDEASGEATRILAEATDPGCKRKDRVLLIRPDRGYDAADAKKRADWEARTRAARADKVIVGVLGWRQPNGKLWAINTRSRVRAPNLLGVDGDLVITQVEFTIGEGGKMTQLSLVRPDAFEPEPTATVKESGGRWKELDRGAL